MPLENMIVLGVIVASMVAFIGVTAWMATESGARRKQEREIASAE